MRHTHSSASSCAAQARPPLPRLGRGLALLPLLRPLLLAVLLAVALVPPPARAAGPEPTVPVPGQVTMVDLGAKSCIPCKMMAPILSELEAEYRGRAAILFIDVRENPDQVDKFGLRAIPTQIFYDRTGRETWRHEGFLDKASIVARLKGLGADEGK
jgi:thioredoxin 1